jgi:hypothetical protein
LIHIDVKKLGRIVDGAGHRITGDHGRRDAVGRIRDVAGRQRCLTGWEFVHIAVDDATRLAYAEVLTDEQAVTAVAFLRRAVAFFARHGVEVQRVLTDNGSPYRSTVHAIACHALGIRHQRTRPRRAIYRSSRKRTAALDGWLWHYTLRPRPPAAHHQAEQPDQDLQLDVGRWAGRSRAAAGGRRLCGVR